MNVFTKTISLGDDRTITIETGKLAKQADGSVVVREGDTMLLATVVSARDIKPNMDFMPLSVEYREKFAAAGRFPGGFRKREARPDDSEILTARLIDRVLRPLFPKDFHAETFVTVELISADRNKEALPDALAGLAASAALMLSDVPFNGPISEVRVARINGKFKLNPTRTELETADIDIMVGATHDYIMMVEGEMSEISEEEMVEALRFGHDEIKKHCIAQMELAQEAGYTKKRDYQGDAEDEALYQRMKAEVSERVRAVAESASDKNTRAEQFTAIHKEFVEKITAEYQPEAKEVPHFLMNELYHKIQKDEVRKMMLTKKVRLDGRKPDQIRPIWSEVDYLPGAHGSAVFTRGETQSLTSVTLGTPLDEQSIDMPLVQGKQRFLLHYNFPPYSTGEARPNRGTGRREIGHGNLAHRALSRMIPPKDVNPYAIRIVSDILESNGSSSMATVCAGTLALMDAGVQIVRPVSGIAMGLITDESGNFVVLSDILGDEDHLGDMDFKVTGTTEGITACQMDIKVGGLSYEILTKALHQAKAGRAHILGEMLKTIEKPRDAYKPHVPGMITFKIPTEFIGAVIGPGGKIIQEIQASTGTHISIEETGGFGEVTISGPTQDSIDQAYRRVKQIVAIPEVDQIYTGKVKAIHPFGAFVEIMPGKDGLLHISEIDHKRIEKVEDVLKEGQIIDVKLIEIDKKTGKLKLSRKVLLEKPQQPKK